MTNEEARQYIICRRDLTCRECYPEIGFGGSEICSSCEERKSFNMAVEALEFKSKVIYCKECMSYDKNTHTCNLEGKVEENDFCSFGWNKEN